MKPPKKTKPIITKDMPRGWRKGQTVFNFLEWLLKFGYAPANQNQRLADPFHLSDEEWDKMYQQFLNLRP